ncbi:hypothetical protein AB0B79_08410 [Streptomyces sp. NPDC039022]|uniref:hypothetical protein n=1 Tax=Streptomyces sp. NPDC039022 TaxID=3157091 RepID=UPI0033D1A72E
MTRHTPIRPPMLAVTEAELDDLRSRLLHTRWPTPWPTDEGEAGTDPGELRRLVTHGPPHTTGGLTKPPSTRCRRTSRTSTAPPSTTSASTANALAPCRSS